MKKILIVTPFFPPGNAPDMQRVRMSLPHYKANGWEPVVLAVGGPWQGGILEPALLATLPADVRIVYTRAFPSALTRFAGVGHLGHRALPFLFWKGSQLLRKEKFDLVFFSNTQFVTFILGPIWKRLFNLPYVLDIQDPWFTDYYERPGSRRPPGGWKYKIAKFLAWLLEGPCIKGASAVISVSPSYLHDLRTRYPGFTATPSAVLGFGASQADIAAAASLPKPTYSFPRTNGEKHLLYTGAAGPVMPHALTVLFTAFRMYRERHPEKAARFRFHFVGTSYVAPGQGRPSVLGVAEQCGVLDQVQETPHRIGYLEAIQLQQEADVLLLLGSSDLAYSPSKAYTYFLTLRPILGIVFRDSVMERLLDELTCAYMVRFRSSEPKGEAWESLIRFFDLVDGGLTLQSLPPRNDDFFNKQFLTGDLAQKQCALFDRAVEIHHVAKSK